MKKQEKTSKQWKDIVQKCKDIFLKKHKDYGSSWRILRLLSLTDQIYIKAQRLRSIEEKGEQKVADSIDGEYIGMINYCIMALIQINNSELEIDLKANEAEKLYDAQAKKFHDLLMAKNHDYGEAWRNMRITSFTDLILQKIARIKQIEDNDGKTVISEGIGAGYQDILNYSVFALIKLDDRVLNIIKKYDPD